MKIARIIMLVMTLMLSVAGYADIVEIDGLGYNLDTEKKEAVLNRMVEGNTATEIVIPETVVYENVSYPVKSIWILAFVNCTNIASVTIPNTVEKIWDSAFSGCTSLVSVNIPESAKSIGQWAFSDCRSLKSIVIPKSVEKIEDAAFKECGSLESIVVSSENPYYDSREGCNAIIETSTNKLIVGCKNTIVPNFVTAIGRYAFCGCHDLESITLPNSLTNIDIYGFYGCNKLKNIILPESLKELGMFSFSNCTELTSVTIPASVNRIGGHSFEGCTNLSTVYCLSKFPPFGEAYAFDYIFSKELHILKGTTNNYINRGYPWSRFKIIDDIDPVTLTVIEGGGSSDDISTGIESVTNSVTTAFDKIFSVSGQRLGKPVKGVNIIKGKKVVY